MSAEMMNKKVLRLLPKEWRTQFRQFSMEELENDFVTINGSRTQLKERGDIFSTYNDRIYDPRSGSLVKAADNLSAFIEACRAVENGCKDPVLLQVRSDGLEKNYGAMLSTMNLGDIYQQFRRD